MKKLLSIFMYLLLSSIVFAGNGGNGGNGGEDGIGIGNYGGNGGNGGNGGPGSIAGGNGGNGGRGGMALVTVEAMVEMAVTLCLGVTGLTERMEERAV